MVYLMKYLIVIVLFFNSFAVMAEDKIAIITQSHIPFITERVEVANGGYEIWSDGYIEQWGRKEAGSNEVVFHVSFKKEDSISFVIQEYSIGDQYGRQPINFPSVDGVYGFNRSDLKGTWVAKGY